MYNKLTKIVNVHVMIKKLHFKGPGIFHYLSDASNFYFLVYGACSKQGKQKALCAIASKYIMNKLTKIGHIKRKEKKKKYKKNERKKITTMIIVT